MNRIFKIKRNNFGNTVVTSELAKNKGKTIGFFVTLGILASSILSSNVFAGVGTGVNFETPEEPPADLIPLETPIVVSPSDNSEEVKKKLTRNPNELVNQLINNDEKIKKDIKFLPDHVYPIDPNFDEEYYGHFDYLDETITNSAYGNNGNVDGTSLKNTNNIAIGHLFAIETNPENIGTQNILMGKDITIRNIDNKGSSRNVLLGNVVTSAGSDVVAIGTGSAGLSDNTVAIGNKSIVQGENSVSTGSKNIVVGENSGVLGTGNEVKAENTFVLGSNVVTDVVNSVALGANSFLENPVKTKNMVIQNKTYEVAGKEPVGTVSIGSKNGERTLTYVAAGRVNELSTDAVNGSQLHAVIKAIENQKEESVSTGSERLTVEQIGVNETGGKNFVVDLSQTTKTEIDKISKGLNTLTDDGITKNRQFGDTVAIKGDDKNISTSTETNGTVRVNLKDNITAKSVKTGNVSISEDGVDAGNKKVTNVADGDINADSKDAINGSQLHNVLRQISVAQGNNTVNIVNNNKKIEQVENKVDNLSKKVDRNHKEAKSGIAGAAAIAGLPQVRGNGKSMVAASVGNFKGSNAIAVGYSRASDNGKLLLKLSSSVNNKGDFVSSAGIGYEW